MNSFNLAVMESVVMASARTDHHRVTRWIRRVEYPKVKLKQLADLGPHYENLDNKLAWALTKMADKSGEFTSHSECTAKGLRTYHGFRRPHARWTLDIVDIVQARPYE